jgi:hypothetical protein
MKTMTINYKSVNMLVEYDYKPETGPEAQYQGCHEKVTIIAFYGRSFMKVFENDIKEIEQIILNEIHESGN